MTTCFRPATLSALALLAGTALGADPVLAASQETRIGGPVIVLAQASVVRELQRDLNRLGYDAGPVDGLMGARTRAAIRAYQQDHGLLVTGEPSQALLEHVRGVVARQLAPVVPAQPAPPAAEVELVASIQRSLRDLGYSVPTTAGRMTEETREAIRAYERDQNLLVTGEPSRPLLEHMRARLAAAEEAVDADTIARIQSELRRRGYDIPAVSGEVDFRTRSAIRQYQQARGLPVTGEASASLLAELTRTAAEPAPSALTWAQIAQVQRALNERGYEAGPPDGTLGPRTRTAIRTFQADSGLEPSGQITPQTLERLGVVIAAPVEPPPPPAPEEPRYIVQLFDDFADGDHSADPMWRIVAGSFEVRDGGLASTITPQEIRGAEDFGRRLLGAVLQQQLGVGLPGQEGVAAAYVPTRIANAFRITLEVSGGGGDIARLDLGPYRGRNIGHGYRLGFRADAPRPFQLAVNGEAGASSIASAPLALADGQLRRIVWERDGDGRMTVSVDGEVFLETRDRTLAADFDGFSLINGGGEWVLHEVKVEGLVR